MTTTEIPTHEHTLHEPTFEQRQALDVARVGFMSACPFYAHMFYSICREVLTLGVPTAATDGRHIFINPEYVASLKPAERIFVYAHEMKHVVDRHPQRMAHYAREGKLGGLDWDQHLFNQAADYCINAELQAEGVGMMNPSWLWDAQTSPEDLTEDTYARHFKAKPPQPQGSKPKPAPGKTLAGSGHGPRGVPGDKQADSQGGGFDSLMAPPVSPVTGKADLPDDGEFKEAVARAATAAKAMGKLPGSLQRKIDTILEPQVDWREHVRMVMTGHIGARRETWDKLNRRRLVLNPMVCMPGRRGYGAELVAVVVDNSGSITEAELRAYFSEVAGILADVRPREVVLIWCDAAVRQVDRASSLDEMEHIRVKGSPGGGGTDFNPPFDYLEREGVRPETLIYCTDMHGRFPVQAPGYPVVWAATTSVVAPFGDTVHVKVAA